MSLRFSGQSGSCGRLPYRCQRCHLRFAREVCSAETAAGCADCRASCSAWTTRRQFWIAFQLCRFWSKGSQLFENRCCTWLGLLCFSSCPCLNLCCLCFRLLIALLLFEFLPCLFTGLMSFGFQLCPEFLAGFSFSFCRLLEDFSMGAAHLFVPRPGWPY